MKRRSTKSALILSVLSLVICLSMLAGTTYAWFTDTVASAGNIIRSGILDADLVDENNNSLEGQVINFKKSDAAPAGEELLWEPGCTYELETVYVKNNGNLAFKYRIIVVGIDGDAKLLEAIDWTVKNPDDDTAYDLNRWYHLLPGETSPAITLSGHMREEAGNEYQNLTADGISIMIYAVQDTVEYDSFTNQYDAMAAEPFANVTKAGTGISPIYDVFNVNNVIPGAELDSAYKFSATEDGVDSPYKDWHADFVIYADGDIAADSVVLAGMYERAGYPQFSGKWLGAVNEGSVVTAGTEIRLLKDLGGVGVSYAEVCDFRDFYCGIGEIIDGANAGTTVTVELRIYEATGGGLDTETGNYIVISTTEYTFG